MKLILKICAASVLLITAIGPLSTTMLRAATMDPRSVKKPEMTSALLAGKQLYDAKCAECHGVNTVGTNKGPPFLHRVYHPGHHGDGAFFYAVRRGVKQHHWPFGNMPPVPGLTDEQIKSIIRYVRALQDANGVF
ncbi:MAG: cytochrome c [Rhodospirillaceae bacterium]|nr:cytochrome c [Rhodospirillaceae bacterium]MDD9925462.1 cytochrome c [Rhodospirillaceae bacterium]